MVQPENNINKITMTPSFTPLIKNSQPLNKNEKNRKNITVNQPEIMQQGGGIYDLKHEILKIIS